MFELDRPEEALPSAYEAIEILRPLAAARPAVFKNDLALNLYVLGGRLMTAGRREEGIAVSREAVSHLRQIAESSHEVHLSNLAEVLHNFGRDLQDSGFEEEARRLLQESVELYRRLVESNPEEFLPELAGALGTFSYREEILLFLGRRKEALASLDEAIPYLQEAKASLSGMDEDGDSLVGLCRPTTYTRLRSQPCQTRRIDTGGVLLMLP